jgi:hypothetical protein
MVAAAALAAFCTADLAAGTAFAADLDGATARKKRIVRHHKPKAPRHAYAIEPDPYAYQYEPRGYYPFYGTAYWRPAAWVRYRDRLHYNEWNRQPPLFTYYPSWGYPTRKWSHKDWHHTHHGRHLPWHW